MRGTILFIDDDADDRELFYEAMEEIAPEIMCHTVGSGLEAMKMLARPEVDLPDIIFLDINMPLINGWEFLALLKENESYKSLPVIMYSTSSHEKEKELAKKSGALELITKPNSYEKLKTILKVIVHYIHTHSLPEFTINSLEV